MNPPGEIALCIPAYKAAAYLPRLLQAARAQTEPFAEIWVYDDASPDDTAAVAESFGARVIRGKTNKGCSYGKNALARATTCPWLHFHDSDDSLFPDFVEKTLPWRRQSPSRDVVFFSYEARRHEDETHIDHRRFDDEALRTDALGYLLAEQVNPFCGLYRREPFLAAGGWDEDPCVLQSEDQAGHLRLALAGLTFAADPAVTVINYIRAGSMTTSNLAGANRSTYHVLRKAQESRLRVEHARIVGRRAWRVAGSAAAYLDWETADGAAALATELGGALPEEAGLLFRALTPISPPLALRVRERLIRWFKPHQRRGAVYHPAPAR
jgi:glycosyltransferase involved in cell wall biosynthesis